MREHFYNIIRFENEKVAVIEFRKRVSWYAKQMNPCGILREGMRVINSAADFDRVTEEFLTWRESETGAAEHAETAECALQTL
jgi:tRNA-dihydrouridine synthase